MVNAQLQEVIRVGRDAEVLALVLSHRTCDGIASAEAAVALKQRCAGTEDRDPGRDVGPVKESFNGGKEGPPK